MYKKNYFKRKGFTFSELMISITVMSFGLFTILGVLCAVSTNIKKGENHLVAINLAQQYMEMYKSELTFDFNKYGDSSDLPITGTLPVQVLNKITHTPEITISRATDLVNTSITYPPDLLREITIKITWKEINGGVRSYTLHSYVRQISN
jgi:competence protein ComGC